MNFATGMTTAKQPPEIMGTSQAHRADFVVQGGTPGADQRGFTLIELLTVIAILGILSTLAIVGYTKNLRNARRTEVIGDLSNISLRENAMLSARGHYASTASDEDDTYPVAPNELANKSAAISWAIEDAGYTRDAVAVGTPYFQAGGLEHGFDAMNFIPEGGDSWCVYGVISGDGTNGEFGDEPPAGGLGQEVFPAGDAQLERFYARDWFYAFAKCDFDRDGVFWEFTTAHFITEVSMGDSNYGE